MKQIAVVYWSGTGNTEVMARKVKEGVETVGAEAHLFSPNEFKPEMIDNFEAIAFGCPSMGAEELEEIEFAPMFESCRGKLEGKKIALFGSYGWGDGEWMRLWEADCQKAGAKLVCDFVICQEQPDSTAEAACVDLGIKLTS